MPQANSYLVTPKLNKVELELFVAFSSLFAKETGNHRQMIEDLIQLPNRQGLMVEIATTLIITEKQGGARVLTQLNSLGATYPPREH